MHSLVRRIPMALGLLIGEIFIVIVGFAVWGRDMPSPVTNYEARDA